MFSGIIDRIGKVRHLADAPGGKTLVVAAEKYWIDAPGGASVAIDGVCLTLTQADGNEAHFDVVAETLRRTTLGDLRPGDRVNLQKSIAVGERMDGHFVQGHVDAMGTVKKVEQSPNEAMWWFSTDARAMGCIIPKGSVAIDGISLTIADVRDGLFSVALIPTTLERTTMGGKKVGARANIETDILARTVVSYLESIGGRGEAKTGSLTTDLFERHGFR